MPRVVRAPGTAPVLPAVPLEEAARRLGYAHRPWRGAARSFPVRWPAEYLHLAETAAGAPLRAMGVPEAAELVPDPGDLADPVGERPLAETPFVVRKHRDRAILLLTARCHFYCRFCFRRSFPDGGHRDPTAAQLAGALAHLASDRDLREVILSGGDPLVLSDERIAEVVAAVAAMPSVERLRVHTRAPVHQPDRVTPQLAAILAGGKPARVVTHFEHAVEITDASRGACATLASAGLPVLSQGVLLRGVNDDAGTLADLFEGLAASGVRPYYLHHPDRVPGSARFRVTIERGLDIWSQVAARVPPERLPQYVIDVPDGSGKVPVTGLARVRAGRWRAPGGFEWDDVAEAP